MLYDKGRTKVAQAKAVKPKQGKVIRQVQEERRLMVVRPM